MQIIGSIGPQGLFREAGDQTRAALRSEAGKLHACAHPVPEVRAKIGKVLPEVPSDRVVVSEPDEPHPPVVLPGQGQLLEPFAQSRPGQSGRFVLRVPQDAQEAVRGAQHRVRRTATRHARREQQCSFLCASVLSQLSGHLVRPVGRGGHGLVPPVLEIRAAAGPVPGLDHQARQAVQLPHGSGPEQLGQVAVVQLLVLEPHAPHPQMPTEDRPPARPFEVHGQGGEFRIEHPFQAGRSHGDQPGTALLDQRAVGHERTLSGRVVAVTDARQVQQIAVVRRRVRGLLLLAVDSSSMRLPCTDASTNSMVAVERRPIPGGPSRSTTAPGRASRSAARAYPPGHTKHLASRRRCSRTISRRSTPALTRGSRRPIE